MPIQVDPLDREILQRALEAACAAVRDRDASPEYDSDGQLERGAPA
jgi:hypothetical protein